MNFLRKLFGLDHPAPAATPGPGRARDREVDLKGLEGLLKYNLK